jgi:hypothetical protein
MWTIDQFLTIVDRFAKGRQIGIKRASTLIFNAGGRIDEIRAGSDVGTRRLDRAMRYMSANWPDGSPWPADIVRPASLVDAGSDAVLPNVNHVHGVGPP